MSFTLLVLDVLFGVSVLNAMFELDVDMDAALDLTEAGFLAARNSNVTPAFASGISLTCWPHLPRFLNHSRAFETPETFRSGAKMQFPEMSQMRFTVNHSNQASRHYTLGSRSARQTSIAH